jgi:hypothetical protein
MLIHSIWVALGVSLPASRGRHMLQFLAGLPMHPSSYTSLLRAMARAVIDAGLIPVRKNAAHDPVELIAAGLAAAIARWDTQPLGGRALWADLSIRVAAFEALFHVRLRRAKWTSAIRVLEGLTGEDGSRELYTAAAANEPDALLAEQIAVGNYPPTEAGSLAVVVGAVPLAHGLLLVRAGAYRDALAVFESILKRVPGHTIALQQAARCSSRLGDVVAARGYARRADIRVGSSRTAGSTAHSGRSRSDRKPDDQTTPAMWSRAPKLVQG